MVILILIYSRIIRRCLELNDRKGKKQHPTLLEFLKKFNRDYHSGSTVVSSSRCRGEYYVTNVLHIQGISLSSIIDLIARVGLHVYRFIDGVDGESLSKKCKSFFPIGNYVITPCKLEGMNIEEFKEFDSELTYAFEKHSLIHNIFRYIIVNLLASQEGYTIAVRGRRLIVERTLPIESLKGREHAVLRIDPIISILLNDERKPDSIKVTLNYKIYIGKKKLGLHTLPRNEQRKVIEKIEEILEQIIRYIIDSLSDLGLDVTQTKLNVVSESSLYSSFCIKASIDDAVLSATKYEVPSVTLLFHNNMPDTKPFSIFNYGPYRIPIAELTAYVIAPQSILPGAIIRLKQTIGRLVEKLNRVRRLNIEIDFEDLPLDGEDPIEFARKLRQYNIADQDKGEATIVVLNKRNKMLYEYAKALSLKQNFYFKAQIILHQKLNKMSLNDDGKFITATMFASIIFRGEGTPWLPVVKEQPLGYHDLVSSRLVVGIGFSKPLRRGFTRAAIALIDLYSAHVRVNLLDLGIKRKYGLTITEDDAIKIANMLQKHIEHGNYKEVAVYISKLLSREEAEILYNKLRSKLNVDTVVLISVTKRPPLIVLKRYSTLKSRTLHIKVPNYGNVLLMWAGEQAIYPLTLVIHHPSDLTPSEIRHEIKIVNMLRFMYYPASVHTLERSLAPIEYAIKVARVAHLLK